MTKVVVVLAVIALVLWLMRPRGGRGRRGGAAAPEGLLACAHCGVRLPASEALLGQGLPFCTPAHREAGPRRE